MPELFSTLINMECVCEKDIYKTEDSFCCVFKSIADLLATKGITSFLDCSGTRMRCDKFFDDWYLYAVPSHSEWVYSLFKLREQEFDGESSEPGDGDIPGVTISFVEFHADRLLRCLQEPSDEAAGILNEEINRVVGYRRQNHDRHLKEYFVDPGSEGAYLIAKLYVKHIASFAKNGSIDVPVLYGQTYRQSISYKKKQAYQRIPSFINELNKKEGYTVCDHKKIYIKDKDAVTEAETRAIMATHTGNVSVHSFAAEVEFHARFLFGLAKIRIPFFGRSIYDSAIRADMSIDHSEFESRAPFYRLDSKIVMRQCRLHP